VSDGQIDHSLRRSPGDLTQTAYRRPQQGSLRRWGLIVRPHHRPSRWYARASVRRPLLAVNAAPRAQLNSGYGTDSGPSQGEPFRTALRPIEASTGGTRNVSFTSTPAVCCAMHAMLCQLKQATSYNQIALLADHRGRSASGRQADQTKSVRRDACRLVRISLPVALLVSTVSPPRLRTRSPAPPSSTASSRFTISHRPTVERANRSTLVTTRVSPART
jgi:hypothetical protein